MMNLVINPGSTSTKIAVYENEILIKSETFRHTSKKLNRFEDVNSQLSFRKKVILDFLKKEDIKVNDIDGFIGRGGLMKPLKSGIYQVNDKMAKDLSTAKYGEHASNLGGLIAKEIADTVKKSAYIADPVVVDEMSNVAKISGLNGISRKPLWHALNQKAVARRYAASLGRKYEQMTVIVAHLGGGISVGLHKRGRVTDVNNALDGDGPFSPERTGGLPVSGVYDLAFSGQYSLEQLKKLNYGFGGLVSYLNTNDAEQVSEMINKGHVIAKRVMKAMVYQIAKEIGGLYAVTRNNLDAIIITGGLAYNQDVLLPLLDYLDHLGEIVVYPGEDELDALNNNLNLYFNGLLKLSDY